MNILIVNQSIVDTCASFITLLIAVVEVDGTGMSRNIYDQFVCLVWISRLPLWALLNTSTFGILITAFERYFAVIYPIWYNVRIDATYSSVIISRENGFFCCHIAVKVEIYDYFSVKLLHVLVVLSIERC